MKNISLIKQVLFSLAVLLLASAETKAQYHASIGLRGAKFSSGINAKYYFDADNATGIEVMLGRTKIAKGGWFAAGFFERQVPFKIPILQLPLNFIGGLGIHVGYFPERYYKIVEGKAAYYNNNTTAVSAGALVALEYIVPFKAYPFAVGIEANPFYDLVNKGPEFLDLAITLKYIFRVD